MEVKNNCRRTDILGAETGFSDADNGGGGFECKTCGKRFYSFQALGGHQGIHRKPKLMMCNEDDDEDLLVLSVGIGASSSSLHRCRICMKEFPSGPALGGHMTHHRGEKAFNLPTERECLVRRQEENVTVAGLRRLKKEDEDGRRRRLNVTNEDDLVLGAMEWRLCLQ